MNHISDTMIYLGCQQILECIQENHINADCLINRISIDMRIRVYSYYNKFIYNYHINLKWELEFVDTLRNFLKLPFIFNGEHDNVFDWDINEIS